jgi:hypothetical protein
MPGTAACVITYIEVPFPDFLSASYSQITDAVGRRSHHDRRRALLIGLIALIARRPTDKVRYSAYGRDVNSCPLQF